MKEFFKQLKQQIAGEVHFDPLTRKIYSVDASIYEVEPIGIVIPKDKRDLRLALKIAAEFGISVTARGAATGITGSCLGKGLIIDTSKSMDQILEINIAEEYAIVEPGVVQDRLNDVLSPLGYRLGPDTSTGNRATIGGMLANNSAGARSLFYGCMADHVMEVELALTGGHLLTLKPLNQSDYAAKRQLSTQEGHIYREVYRLLDTYHDEIEAHFPKVPRYVSGYNLGRLKGSGINLSKIIAGSEGTLGIATEIKVKIAKKPRYTGLCVIHVRDTILAMHALEHMLTFKPLALEMIDDKILNTARESPSVKHKIGWLIDNPQAVFVAEFEGASRSDVEDKIHTFSTAIRKLNVGYAHVTILDPDKITQVWDVRKAGLGLLLSKRSYNRAIAFIEDISIAPEKLSSFMEQFTKYLRRIGKEAGIYGHIGSGCMHIRPYIDLRSPDEVRRMREIMETVSTMVLDHGGAMSGEHGDGLIRSWLNEKMFGPDLYKAFKELKAAFDPLHLMNPGKITDGPPLTQDLRLSPESKLVHIPTFLDFSAEGGFELAADLCNGNGQCRKAEGLMCPSFQATGDEYDTTRARAQSLRSIIHGKLPIQELTGKALLDVLDLCLECKGCKRECPSQVDMAKMKSEILYQHKKKHGTNIRSRLFAHLHTINKIASPFAPLFNAMSRSKPSKKLMDILGITQKRELPELAKERFSTWFKKQPRNLRTEKVALFNDTYTEFNQPEIGMAAYKVLSALGYEVILINGFCCGRPLISKGFLEEAQKQANTVIENLFPYAFQNIPIVTLEPSCISALRDDYKGLISDKKKLEETTALITSFDEFIHSHIQEGKLPLKFYPQDEKVLVHTHCHQKALLGSEKTLEVLKAAGFDVQEIASGCCGMAGSFGYEKEHYDISMRIGELHLLPTVRNASLETTIIASGMSCRSQIHHGTSRQALHLAEALKRRMKDEG